MIESVYNSVLIYYIYTTHAIVVKLDNVRIRREAVVLVAKSFVLLITLRTLLLSSTFDVWRRTGLLSYSHFHSWTFSYLLSILASAFDLSVLFIQRKFHPKRSYRPILGCYKIVKNQGAISPFQFFR